MQSPWRSSRCPGDSGVQCLSGEGGNEVGMNEGTGLVCPPSFTQKKWEARGGVQSKRMTRSDNTLQGFLWLLRGNRV